MKRASLLFATCVVSFAFLANAQGNFVNQFDGSIFATVPIMSPIGLGYSSAGVPVIMSAENRDVQTSWVGAGWSLEVGSIVANLKGTTNTDDDDWYFRSAAGGGTRIVKDINGVLRLENDPSWKIELTLSGDLVTGVTVTTGDGTKMKFGDFQVGIGSKQANRCTFYWGGRLTNFSSDANGGQICYRWDLSQVVDPYGVTLSDYYYFQDTVCLNVGSGGASLAYTRASYIDRIVDARTGQVVKFVRGARSTAEYQNVATSSYKQSMYETKYLDSIRVYPTTSSTQPVRMWDFSYQLIGSGSRTKRILSSITELERNGRALPSTSFSYDSTRHYLLSAVLSPTGGTTNITTQAAGIPSSNDTLSLGGVKISNSGRTVVTYDTITATLHIKRWTGRWISKDFQPSPQPAIATEPQRLKVHGARFFHDSSMASQGKYPYIPPFESNWWTLPEDKLHEYLTLGIPVTAGRPGASAGASSSDDHIFVVYRRNSDLKMQVVMYDWRDDVQDWQVGFSVGADAIDASYTRLIGDLSPSGSEFLLIAGGSGTTYTAQVRMWDSKTRSWSSPANHTMHQYPSSMLQLSEGMALFDQSDGAYLLQWKKVGGSFIWKDSLKVCGTDYPENEEYTLRTRYVGQWNRYFGRLRVSNLTYDSAIGFDTVTSQSQQDLGAYYDADSSRTFAKFTDERIVVCQHTNATVATLKIWSRDGSAFSALPDLALPVIWSGYGWKMSAQINNDWIFALNYLGPPWSDAYPYRGKLWGYYWNQDSSKYSPAGSYEYSHNDSSVMSSWAHSELRLTGNYLIVDPLPLTNSACEDVTDAFKLDRSIPQSWNSSAVHVLSATTQYSVRQPVTFMGSNFVGTFPADPNGCVSFSHGPDENWSDTVTVYRVTQVTTNDGMGHSVTENFTYDGAPTFDPSLSSPAHAVVRTSLGQGEAGFTRTYFKNSLSDPYLKGLTEKVESYNQDSSLISRSAPTWQLYRSPARWYQFQVRKIADTTMVDGVAKVSTFLYNNLNGQISATTDYVGATSNLAGPRDLLTEITYAYEQLTEMRNANRLIQVSKTRASALNTSGSAPSSQVSVSAVEGGVTTDQKQYTVNHPQTNSYTANAYQGHFFIGTSLGGNDIVNFESFAADEEDTSGSFAAVPGVTYYIEASVGTPERGDRSQYPSADGTVSYNSGDPVCMKLDTTVYSASTGYPGLSQRWNGSQWITTDSVVSRDSYGNVLESDNTDKVRTVTKYGYNATLPIATITKASASQCAVSIFDDGDVAAWSGSNGTYVVQNGVYQQTDGTTTATWIGAKYNTSATLDDGVFEGDVRFDNAGTSRYAGLMKYQNSNAFVRFELRKSDGVARIHAQKSGGYTLSSSVAYTFNENQWYHVRGEIQGTTAKMYINGQFIVSLTNFRVDIISGYIALPTYATVASFDNVRMYPLGAIVNSVTYDPTTLQAIRTTDPNGVSTLNEYDGFGQVSATKNDDKKILSAHARYYSRDGHAGSFSSSDPNLSCAVTYTTPTGYSDFSSGSGWTSSGGVTFGVQVAGETAVQIGNAAGQIYKKAAGDDVITRADFFYASSLTGANRVLELDFEAEVVPPGGEGFVTTAGLAYRFGVVYDVTQSKFRAYYFAGTDTYPYDFTIPPQANVWYTIELEKDASGRCRAWVYRKGEGRNYADMCTATGIPSGYIPWVYSVSTTSRFSYYLANHYVGSFSETTTYSDGLGRTLQTQVRDGSKDLVSAVEYDAAGRQYRSWRTYSYATGHAYDALFASHDTATYHISNPYTETSFKEDPLSRVDLQKPLGRSVENEDVISDYDSATLADGVLYRYAQSKQKNSNSGSAPWMISRQYTDKLGRAVRSSTYADGVAGDTLTTRSCYTLMNQPFMTVAPKGDSTVYEYDFLGRVTQKKNPDEGTSKYAYDKAGRLRFMVDSVGLAAGTNKVLYWKYDSFGRVTEKGYLNGPNWGDGSSYRSYAAGDPSYPTTPATWRKKYNYDNNGTSSANLIGRLYSVATNNDDDDTSEVTESFTYDKFGNVTTVAQKVSNFSTLTYSTVYSYDLLGRMVEVVYPDTTYGKIDVTYSYDQVGRTTAVGAKGGSAFAAYTYGPDGGIDSEKVNLAGPALKVRKFNYDARGRLSSIAGDLFTEIMTYDNGGYDNNEGFYHGLIAFDSTRYYAGGPTPHGYHFKYDNFGRLTVADDSISALDIGVGGSPTSYDLNGNIQTIKRGASSQQTYTYHTGTNRVQTMATGTEYFYDQAGNLTQSVPQAYLTLGYDPFTQLAMSTTSNYGWTYLQYGGAKQRVYKKVIDEGTDDTTVTVYLHGGMATPVQEKSTSGPQRSYVYGPTGLLAMKENATWYYLMKDHLGSTRVVFNQSGSVSSTYDYDALGKLGRSTINTNMPYRFTGQEFDFETNLHNFRARMYDSDLGMFYATDPAGQSSSPYGYALNNPVSLVDPTGRVNVQFYMDRYFQEMERKQNLRMWEEANREASWRLFTDMMELERDDGFSIHGADVRLSMALNALRNYGDYMRRTVAGWGTSGYHYGNRDEAARAAYYTLLANLGSEMFRFREYGGNIYSNRADGTYSFSSAYVASDIGATEIDYESGFLRLAVDDERLTSKQIDHGGGDIREYTVVGAAIFHTHWGRGGFSGWDQSGDTKVALYHTSELSIYLLNAAGESSRFTWPGWPPEKKLYFFETKGEHVFDLTPSWWLYRR